jgi:hypothetical protein
MKIIRGLAMIACVAIIACVAASEASAEQRNWFGPSGGRSMFWGGMFAPQPTFYPPPRQRYYRAPSRRSVHRDTRARSKVVRASPSSAKRVRRTAALAGATSAIPAAAEGRVTCERAQAIVAEYGFTEIQPETCEGRTYGFTATRDGKPFSIKIVAADGELAEVKKR